MKKLMILMFVLALAACSEEAAMESNGVESVEEAVEQAPDYSMDSFINAYESAGIAVNPEEKPAFGMISAIDGVIFYNENQPVKIYQFNSEETIGYAKENFPFMETWEQKGLFLLETSDPQAIEIFNSVE